MVILKWNGKAQENPTLKDVADIGKLLISDKIYFEYKDNGNVIILCIMPPKISEYAKKFNKANYMFFSIKDDEKWNKTWYSQKYYLKKIR